MTNEEALTQGDKLYERYAKPLEAEHWGKYIAIATDGRTMLGTDMTEVQYDATRHFGGGVRIFKVGPKVIGRLRSPVKAIIVSKGTSASSGNEEAWHDEDAFYERYAKHLEAEHWGKVVAIAPDGRTLLGTNVEDMEFEASDTLGDSFILFKVGRMAVSRI